MREEGRARRGARTGQRQTLARLYDVISEWYLCPICEAGVCQRRDRPACDAFSPDEKYLYVGDWDEKKKVVMRYEAKPDGTLANGKVFFDMTGAKGEDALDGIKVGQQ